MNTLNTFVFLFIISISTLVIPSILPKTTFIGILFLLLAILLSIYGLNNINLKTKIQFYKNINYKNILFPLLTVSMLFFLFWSRLYFDKPEFISGFATLLLHILFLNFIILTRDYLLIYLRAYIYFVVVMAAAGLTANFLVSLGIVDAHSNYVNISQMTGGAFNRDVGSNYSYLFPYNLGFILTSSGKLSLLGFEFFRISGWAHEPTSATLFIAPAILLLIHSRVIEKLFIRFLFLAVVTTFWFFAMSVGSFLAFTLLYSFYFIVTLYTKIFPLKMSILIFSILIIAFSVLIFLFKELVDSSLLYTKFDLGSQTLRAALDRITWFVPENSESQAKSFSFIFIYTIIFLFLINIFYSFSKQQNLNVYGLILLYIVIHSMKGSQDSVYTHVFTFFWFYVLYFSNPIKVRSVK